MGIGGWELLVIFFVVLLVFGPKRIPEVARGLGKGMRELRRISNDFQREINLAELDESFESRPKQVPAREVPPNTETAEAPAAEVLPKPSEGAVARAPAQAPEGRE